MEQKSARLLSKREQIQSGKIRYKELNELGKPLFYNCSSADDLYAHIHGGKN